MRTKEKLAAVLEKRGLTSMAKLAREGRWDDFESESATPIVDLVIALTRAGHPDLADRAKQGEWDSTEEESEAWIKSPDGQSTLRELLPKGKL